MYKRKVLIGSEDIMLGHSLKAFIPWNQYGGCSILQAGGVFEILEKFRELSPEITIIDMDLIGFGNATLIEAMRAINDRCIIILVGEEKSLQFRYIQSGVSDFLIKPIEPYTLQLVIARSIAQLERQERLFQKLEVSQNMLTKAKSLLIQNLALEITRGTFESDHDLLESHFAELDIRFSYSQYICFVGSVRVQNEPAQKIPYSACFEAIRSNTYKHFPQRKGDVIIADSLTVNDENHISIIVGFNEADSLDSIKDYVRNTFEDIQRLFALPYTLVISPVTQSISNIRKQYQDSKQLCSYLMFTMQYGIFYSDSFSPQSVSQLLAFHEWKNAFLLHLTKNDTNGLHRDILSLRQSALETPIKDVVSLFLYMQDIMAIGAMFLSNHGKQIEDVYSTDIFSQCFFNSFNDLDALLAWIEQYFITICNVVHASTRFPEHPEFNLTVEYVKDYIEKNYTQALSLKNTSKIVHYNPNYFGRVFKRHTGLKFSDYLHKIRIEKAMELLNQTNHSMPEIALLTGYADPSYFFKIFKKIAGITPADFREKHD